MIIYGASGHGKVICDILLSHNRDEQIIFVDDADKGKRFYGYPVYFPHELDLKNSTDTIIIAIGDNITRKNIVKQYNNFAILIHPSTVFSPTVKIGEGSVVMANVSCNADTQIGNHVILNTSCTVDHDCIIENYVHISPNVSIAGNVKIGEGSHIGIGASVIQGIEIGKFATIGAGTVVINDVPDGATVVGVPGKIIKTKG